MRQSGHWLVAAVDWRRSSLRSSMPVVMTCEPRISNMGTFKKPVEFDVAMLVGSGLAEWLRAVGKGRQDTDGTQHGRGQVVWGRH